MDGDEASSSCGVQRSLRSLRTTSQDIFVATSSSRTGIRYQIVSNSHMSLRGDGRLVAAFEKKGYLGLADIVFGIQCLA